MRRAGNSICRLSCLIATGQMPRTCSLVAGAQPSRGRFTPFGAWPPRHRREQFAFAAPAGVARISSDCTGAQVARSLGSFRRFLAKVAFTVEATVVDLARRTQSKSVDGLTALSCGRYRFELGGF